MIESKVFELRDDATFIPIIASRMVPVACWASGIAVDGTADSRVQWLLRRAGYSRGRPYLVLLTRLDGGISEYDPYSWGGNRTWVPAHQHIAEHWDELESGDLIDVRVLLGEESAPCESEYSIAAASWSGL